MPGSRRECDISFYEELGVANDASPEEIRNSFRALARILHPDQHPDPQLKAVAERQMRKLNRIYNVLSDPQRRRRYDELQEDDFPGEPEQAAAEPARIPSRFVWAGAAVVSASLLLWLWVAYGSQSGTFAIRNAAPRSASAPGDATETARLRADLRAVEAERDAAIGQLARLRRSPLPAARPAVPPDAAPALAELPAITELPSASHPVSRGFAGSWVYRKPTQWQASDKREDYPPEFIEATITETSGGIVQGKYRSRLRIVDRAISPDVNFSFGGPAGPTFNWIGPGGAHGEITLRLAATNQLRVDWTAAELGSQQGLASGTAVLTRRSD